ncbi:membrane associated guanylate kinase, WW and PDZ domain containing protein magi isoform X2 [Choristoneura fumiferana]|uniref:membrane associated guanylate kinase, WW and PDZ domain containing protein magi isoform X2 n=1 Tax=Choristoneura fumiferana TaxID=7141 RepID=UPI003D154C61
MKGCKFNKVLFIVVIACPKSTSHNTGTSHWLDPRLARVRKHSLGECGEDELPYGWERVTDERYGSYYVDHINRRTQYENPVLQARRLRADKGPENGGSGSQNGANPSGELRGERFSLTLTKSTQGLGFTLIGAEGLPETEGYLQIRSIVPNSPAWIDGALRPGDVLVGVGGRGVRGLSHAQVAQIFQSIAPGTNVALHLARGYPLSYDSEDPNTRVLSTLAVDANTPATSDAVAMQQLTRALRTRFNLDSPSNTSPGRDEADSGGHSPGQRRLLSRSFDLEALGPAPEPPLPPRCPSADQLHTDHQHLSNNNGQTEPGRELVLTLRRGAAGFGFTIADSVHGQKVKKVLDRSRCSGAGLREGDLLLQIGDTDVRHAPHQRVVQVLKDCPAMHETTIRVWRRNNAARAPRSRSATRVQPATTAVTSSQLGRSKTPTAEQLRSPSLHAQDSIRERLNAMNSVEATYAVPEHKPRESLMERRRRSSTPGGRLTLPAAPYTEHAQWQERETWVDNANNIRTWAENTWEQNGQKWENGNGWEGERWNGNWGEVPTPTVHVDMNAAYWRGNASVADSSDNGGFPEDGMLHSPTTAALGGLPPHAQSPSASRMRPHSPSNSTGRLRSQSPSNTSASERLLSPSARLNSRSPSNNSGSARGKEPMRHRENSPSRHMHSPVSRRSPSCYDDNMAQQNSIYVGNYPQVSAGGALEPEADVLVRLARGAAGFGFRIVGGTEDGSRIAVGYVVPGGPADGLLRPGDLLTSADGVSLAGATHALAVAYVCQAAARGHVTLGVRHNRADIQQLGLPNMPAQHQHQLTSDPGIHMSPASYNILHPAPVYPPTAAPMPNYGGPYGGAAWPPAPYDVTVTREDGEGFGFVVISSSNKATSTIGQLIPNSPAARCGLLHVGDTIVAINHTSVRNLPHPEVVALIKHSHRAVTLTVMPPHD